MPTKEIFPLLQDVKMFNLKLHLHHESWLSCTKLFGSNRYKHPLERAAVGGEGLHVRELHLINTDVICCQKWSRLHSLWNSKFHHSSQCRNKCFNYTILNTNGTLHAALYSCPSYLNYHRTPVDPKVTQIKLYGYFDLPTELCTTVQTSCTT